VTDKTENKNVSQVAPGAAIPAGPTAGAPAGKTAAGGLDFAAMQALAASANPNPALLQFPQDTWGFTTELRKVGTRVASNIRGQEDKHLVYMGTLMVLMAHARARLPVDATARMQQIREVSETMAESERYTRVYGKPVNPEDKVREAVALIAAVKEQGLYKEITG
jgi:hypothetical protein